MFYDRQLNLIIIIENCSLYFWIFNVQLYLWEILVIILNFFVIKNSMWNKNIHVLRYLVLK